MKDKPVISAYYFPNWHVDPRNEEIHGKGWTEWRVVEYATPRFPGHRQPHIPLWGFEDEADPAVMKKKIVTAQKYGIDAFTFDYYWFADGSYRERCLTEGFLPACEGTDFKFAVMWANHDPVYAHPGSYWKPAEPILSGEVKPETFTACTDHLIGTFFKHPNYLRVEGKIYFSIFNVSYMLKTNGADGLRTMFDDLRKRVREAGLGELWLDATFANLGASDLAAANELAEKLGLDSCSCYAYSKLPLVEVFPCFDYASVIEPNLARAKEISEGLRIPYNPSVATGWDASPRTVQSDMYESRGYPFSIIAVNDTPELWEKHLEGFRDFLETDSCSARILHLSCWNEWTEGMYLEPEDGYGYAKLEAVKKVFGPKGK
ncbi:MAG: glycoside hydrolase family 99-like domain-containing protein [Lentisphaeria bacterium]|nr:glycoside hydrolase family 99-like domain-containing protein [Lentisphaeria bacterium]